MSMMSSCLGACWRTPRRRRRAWDAQPKKGLRGLQRRKGGERSFAAGWTGWSLRGQWAARQLIQLLCTPAAGGTRRVARSRVVTVPCQVPFGAHAPPPIHSRGQITPPGGVCSQDAAARAGSRHAVDRATRKAGCVSLDTTKPPMGLPFPSTASPPASAPHRTAPQNKGPKHRQPRPVLASPIPGRHLSLTARSGALAWTLRLHRRRWTCTNTGTTRQWPMASQGDAGQPPTKNSRAPHGAGTRLPSFLQLPSSSANFRVLFQRPTA